MSFINLIKEIGAYLRIKPVNQDPTASLEGTIQYSDGTHRVRGFHVFTSSGWQPLPVGTGLSIGSTQDSYLTVAQFQAINGPEWVLCDGQSAAGSLYESITGNANVPDERGRSGRMKDHGAGINADGDLTVGTPQNRQLGSHSHTTQPHRHSFGLSDNTTGNTAAGGQFDAAITATELTSNTTVIVNATGGNETRGDVITKNVFIRIN